VFLVVSSGEGSSAAVPSTGSTLSMSQSAPTTATTAVSTTATTAVSTIQPQSMTINLASTVTIQTPTSVVAANTESSSNPFGDLWSFLVNTTAGRASLLFGLICVLGVILTVIYGEMQRKRGTR
jgi:hypothetical protein